MATQPVQVASPATGPTRVQEGWIDRLIGLPDRLPGPGALWLAALFLAIVLIGHLPGWLAGESPIGNIEPYVLLPAIIFVYFLGLCRVMARVGRSAFGEFRPALGPESADHDGLGRELTRIPDRQAAAAIGVAVLISLAASMSADAFDDANALPPVGNATAWTLWFLAIAGLGLAVMYTVRQLRWVSRLYAMATNVDLFDTGPVNAFSRLTATSAMGILLVALTFLFGTDESLGAGEGSRWFPLASGSALILLAIASFLSPLRGMHRRLLTEKRRLLSESTARLRQTLALIHGTVDARDFAQADDLQKTLSSLLAERDVLGRLPTWPWSPGILRGFATAAVLPILLWVVIRVLERVV